MGIIFFFIIYIKFFHVFDVYCGQSVYGVNSEVMYTLIMENTEDMKNFFSEKSL